MSTYAPNRDGFVTFGHDKLFSRVFRPRIDQRNRRSTMPSWAVSILGAMFSNGAILNVERGAPFFILVHYSDVTGSVSFHHNLAAHPPRKVFVEEAHAVFLPRQIVPPIAA